MTEDEDKKQEHRSREACHEHLKEPFLDALRKVMFVTQASQAVGINRSTVYRWRDADPEFAKRMDGVDLENTDKLKSEAVRRAVIGVERDIFYKGTPVGKFREYSDRLLELLLKSRDPKFREAIQHQVEITFVAELTEKIVLSMNQAVPEVCPHCKNHLGLRENVIKELEKISQGIG